MNKKRPASKFISIFMALVFMLTLLPGNALGVKAADGDSAGTSNSGLVVDKTATLEADGTYTINLEAYATGVTTTVTEKSGVPLDIVLVIDQSGSMAYNDDGNSTNTESERRMYKLQEAVKSFVSNISANAKEYGVDHRIAIAGYASDNKAGSSGNSISGTGINGSTSYWVNTGLYVNGSFKNYGSNGNGGRPGGNNNPSSLTAEDYKAALVSVNDADGNVTSSITNSINLFKASGGTYTEYGLTMAQNVFYNNPIEAGSNRKRIVVLFTDGETNSDINTVLSGANTLKGNTYNATIYSVGFGSSVDKEFLSHVSSNYTNASYSSWSESYGGTKVEDKYSMTASNREELNKIFKNISQDIQNPSTNVTLDGNAIMRDVLGGNFVLPDDYDEDSQITIKTQAGTVGTDESISWGAITTSPNGISSEVVGTTIEVTGFNYSEKYIAASHPGEKLIVTIKGVLLKSDAATGEVIDTNLESSGIYNGPGDNAECIEKFPIPKTKIEEKSYVLDFAKSVDLSSAEWKQSVVRSLDASGMNKISNNVTALSDMVYGDASIAEQNVVTYTPKRVNWDSFDTFYAFGTWTSDKEMEITTGENAWAKLNVIPATSVYYEDNFNVNADTTDSGVKIIYKGTYETVEDDTTHTNEKQSSANTVYGTDDTYQNDSKYSDGSAIVLQPGEKTGTDAWGYDEYAKAGKAEFTFTGTGVDIYSRTDKNTAHVLVEVYKDDKLMIIDDINNFYGEGSSNEGTGGDEGELYQIPTISLNMGTRGTYKVCLTVGNTTTYYLDGIRVYYPLGAVPEDETAQQAYNEAGENNSAVLRVRDILLNVEQAQAVATRKDDVESVDGIVYVDNTLDTLQNGSNVTLNPNGLTEYQNYGPKSEVYLKPNQAVAFKIESDYLSSDSKVMIGAKAPTGSASEVSLSDGNDTTTAEGKKVPTLRKQELTSATDMYYEVTPNADGCVVIENTGNKMISITKLKITNIATNKTNGLISVSTDVLDYTAAANYANYNPVKKEDIEKAEKNTNEGTDNSAETNSAEVFSGEVTIVDGEPTTEEQTAVTASVWSSVSKSVEQYLTNVQ